MSGWLDRIAAAPDPVKKWVIRLGVSTLSLGILAVWVASGPWQTVEAEPAAPDPQAEAISVEAGKSLEEAKSLFSQIGGQIKEMIDQQFGQPSAQSANRLTASAEASTSTPNQNQQQLEALSQKILEKVGSTSVSTQ